MLPDYFRQIFIQIYKYQLKNKYKAKTNENKAINLCTKRVHWIATKEEGLSAEKFATLFIDFYVRLDGPLNTIASDRDVRFNSAF
jgi:hypothetical protein